MDFYILFRGQFAVYQTGLRQLTLFHFRSASDIAQWFDKFLEHAMLINMHEYFTGRMVFALHDVMHSII